MHVKYTAKDSVNKCSNKITFILTCCYACFSKMAINHDSMLFKDVYYCALLYFKGIIVSLIPHIHTPTSIPTYTHIQGLQRFFSSFLLTTKASVFKGQKCLNFIKVFFKREKSCNLPEI